MSDDDNLPPMIRRIVLNWGNLDYPHPVPRLWPCLMRVRPLRWSRSGTGRVRLTQRPSGTLQIGRNDEAAMITLPVPSMTLHYLLQCGYLRGRHVM